MVQLILWGKLDELFEPSAPTAVRISRVTNATAAKNLLNASRQDETSVLFLRDEELQKDLKGFESAIEASSRLIIILVYEQAPPSTTIAWLKRCSSIDHVIPLRSSNSKLMAGRLFARPELLGHMCREIVPPPRLEDRKEVILRNSGECEIAYCALTKYIEGLNCFSGFDGIVRTIASELLTNAFYNGKRDENTGEPFVSDRRVKFDLDQGEIVNLSFGREQDYLWLVVKDCFGSLDRTTLISALDRAAVERSPKLNGPGGAGLGLLMIYDWATELDLILQPGVSTTVACKLKLTNRNRIFESEGSALHICSNE